MTVDNSTAAGGETRTASRIAPLPAQVHNGDENALPGYTGNFSKGLPHNEFGEVDKRSYQQLLRILASRDSADFELIPLDKAGGRRMTNPQAGLCVDVPGIDGRPITVPPAPSLGSAQAAGELVELYWMALCRDVPFHTFEDNPVVAAAAAEISALPDFRGNKPGGTVDAASVFRGDTPADLVGPYVSQFLLRDAQFGVHRIDQRQDTVAPGKDYMTTFDTWLRVQRGLDRGHAPGDRDHANRRYVTTPRMLSHFVHYDATASPFQAFLNAALILLDDQSPVDPGNPYAWSRTQDGFGTFGAAHLLDTVTQVANRVLKATFYQKWFVHRRLRPEAAGGRVHNHLTGRRDYGFLHTDVLDSEAVGRVHSTWGTYLLPQAFPEGAPTHPSYSAGHATVAGACATVLKAWFDESAPIRRPVVPNPEGTALVAYTGADAGRMTVGTELNKLAANIALGRNLGGVHWRSDYAESVRFGEALAIEILREQKESFNEVHAQTVTRFDGTGVTI